jgi:nucleotide-binding universal stress UspA family protein
MNRAQPIVICYDGSKAAAEVLEFTASVLTSAPAIVVAVWREIVEERLASGAAPPAGDPVEANRIGHRAALEAAREGAKRAKAAGLDAQPVVVKATGPIWRAIEHLAHDRDALLIACGTDRSGLRTVMPGDLAVALVQHSSRPVLTRPAGKAAAERRRQLEQR